MINDIQAQNQTIAEDVNGENNMTSEYDDLPSKSGNGGFKNKLQKTLVEQHYQKNINRTDVDFDKATTNSRNRN